MELVDESGSHQSAVDASTSVGDDRAGTQCGTQSVQCLVKVHPLLADDEVANAQLSEMFQIPDGRRAAHEDQQGGLFVPGERPIDAPPAVDDSKPAWGAPREVVGVELVRVLL